ncbi:MAG: hypothetical protein ABSE22_20480 [Xanthobacteraceae bacterium]|jgi:hypothetical protein
MRINQKLWRGAAAGAVLACLMLAASDAQAGEWLADAKSGCQVWDPNPQLEETVTWSGGCTNGHAEGSGTAQWFKAGARIETNEGQWRDGRQSGKGAQIWPSGRFDGDIADGLPNGAGVLALQKLRYEGQFRDGKPNGIGTLTLGNETLQGTWKDGCLQGGQRKAAIGIPLSDCR